MLSGHLRCITGLSPTVEWGNQVHTRNYVLMSPPTLWHSKDYNNTGHCACLVMTTTAAKLLLSFVIFQFKTQSVVPVLTRKSTSCFPTVSCTQGSCGEMEIRAVLASGGPGQPESSSLFETQEVICFWGHLLSVFTSLSLGHSLFQCPGSLQ